VHLVNIYGSKEIFFGQVIRIGLDRDYYDMEDMEEKILKVEVKIYGGLKRAKGLGDINAEIRNKELFATIVTAKEKLYYC